MVQIHAPLLKPRITQISHDCCGSWLFCLILHKSPKMRHRAIINKEELQDGDERAQDAHHLQEVWQNTQAYENE